VAPPERQVRPSLAAAAGDIDGALALFVSALEAASTTGERWYEPELLRFKAEMLLAQPKQLAIEAEQCLKAAITLARQQEAKFWELRAVAALARSKPLCRGTSLF
jgi:adenylate cyclase